VTISLVIGSQDATAMTVIFDSGPPAGALSLRVFTDDIFFLAEDFIPDASASVTDFHFFTVADSKFFLPIGSTFSYEIRDDGTGQPGNIIIGQGTATVVARDSFLGFCPECLEIWTDFDNPVPVTQGQTFWLVIGITSGGVYILDSVQVGNEILLTLDKVTYTPVSFEGFFTNFPMQITALIPRAIGGELLPIDTTALLLASAQSFSWMIPVLLSGIGIGLFVFRKSENS